MAWPVAAASALSFNFLSSLGVVFANKAVFKTAHFTYPTTLTALHYAANYVIVLALLARGGFEAHTVAADERTLVVLTTAVWAGHNGLSNLSLQKNSVGLYQIFKIAVTPLICAIEFGCYGKRQTGLRACALAGACLGVALATVSDVQYTAFGAAAAMASACMSAVLKVLQTHLLQRRGWTSLQLMHRTWLPQLLLLVLCVPATDGLNELSRYELTLGRAAALGLSVGCSFLLNLSSLLALGETSAVAVVLLGQCKTLAILTGGYLLFDAQPSAKTLLGAALAMFSIGAYTWLSLTSKVKSNDGAVDVDAACSSDGEPAEDVPLRGRGSADDRQPSARTAPEE
eukprot:Transcript_22422.p1 GENE.Transcript_22422~~Transcript_22422.p1  ORF type:complete len:343 (-),score=123.98 Transcript_22422:830-1858(-)